MKHTYIIASLVTSAVLMAACGSTTTTSVDGPYEGSGGSAAATSGEPPVPHGACGPITETRFPSKGLGEAVILCDLCDSTCPDTWTECDQYGDTVQNDDGTPFAVCAACCDGAVGRIVWSSH